MALKKKKIVISLLAGIFVLIGQVAKGAEVKFINTLTNKLKYDTNIIFTRNYQLEDWIYELIPTLGVERKSELTDLKLRAKFRGQVFFKENELNTLDQDYSIDGSHDLSERLNVAISAYYIVDTTTDRELLETGTLLARNNRKHYSIAPSLRWALGERDSVSLSVPLVWTNYDSDRYVDFNTSYATLTFTHTLSDMKTGIMLQPQVADLEFDNSDTQMISFMAGLERQETERLTWSALAGVNYSQSTFETYRLRPINDYVYLVEKYHDHSYDLEWVVLADVRWNFYTGDVRAKFSRAVTESGYGEAVTRLRFVSSANYHLTERLAFHIRGQYSRIEDQGSRNRVDYALYEIGPELTYKLTQNVRIGLYYRYTLEDDKRYSDNFDRNIVGLRLDVKDVTRFFK